MSSRSRLFALCIAVAFAVPLACVPSGDGNSNDGNASLNIGEANSSSPSNSSLPSGGTASRIGNWLRDFYALLNDPAEKQCACNFEDQGYESEQACVDDRTTSQEEIEETANCFEETASEYEADNQPPAGVSDVFDCLQHGVDEVESCISEAEATHSDQCTDEFQSDYGQCYEGSDLEGEACFENADQETQDWLEGVEDAFEQAGCTAAGQVPTPEGGEGGSGDTG